MKKIIINYIIMFFLFFVVSVKAELALPDIVVIGSRAGGQSVRNIQILTPSDLEDRGVMTIDSAAEMLTGSNIRNRGPIGVQQDAGFLAFTQEQTLVMLDGFPVNDPQTAHFNMNIPLPVSALERIECLRGFGSVSHGAGALGGVINFVPGFPSKDTFAVYGGDYQTFGMEFTAGREYGEVKGLFSGSMRKTGNYHPETDSELYSAFSIVDYRGLRTGIGYTDKEYGAYDFYTPGWDMPSREFNRAGFVFSSLNYNTGKLTVTPKIMWRRHWDRYLLTADNPDLYENIHTNDIFSGGLEVKYSNAAAGYETRNEMLDSSSMGNHSRVINSFYGEYTLKPFRKTLLSAGVRYEDIWVPRLSAGYNLTDRILLRTSWGKSFRRPDFTEMYYMSPANTGNKDLEPEKAQSIEAGCDIKLRQNMNLSLTYLESEIKNLIDWISNSKTGPWTAQNTGKQINKSVITDFAWKLKKAALKLGYAYSEADKDSDYYSKYSLNYLRHKINLSSTVYFGSFSINIFSETGFPVNRDRDSFSRMDVTLNRNTDYGKIFIKAENINDCTYSDYEGVPSPGRWVTAGLIW